MEYQSLYRRYRPQRFGDVRGQRHVVRALQNAVRENRVGHAYLLSGPRGTGKTTLARILAKVLNCEAPVEGEPCGECASCKAVEHGTSFDLHELDAASNNKVDDMRDLLSKVALGTPGRTKVYLLDEVHMLSAGAENALLKTLEEPPDHVVFVLATTEPHKVVPTIRSRTQHLELTLLGADEMAEHVRWVIADAGLDVGAEAVDYVVRVGGGSVRDTLSALDQVVAAGGVAQDDTTVGALLEALAERDPGAALASVAEATRIGRDPRVIGESLIAALRGVFLTALGVDGPQLTEAERVRAHDYAERLSPAQLTHALEVVGTALVDMRQAPDPRIDLEVALVKLTRVATDTSLDALVDRLERLERAIASGATAGPAPTPTRAPAPPAPRPAAQPAAPAAPAPADAPAAAPAAETSAVRAGPAMEARQRLSSATGRSAPARPAAPPAARAGRADAPPPPPPGRGGERPASPAPPRNAETPAPARAATPPPAPAPARPVAATSAPGSPTGAGVRTLDPAIWTDRVLPALASKVRARYSAARVAGGDDGAVVLALPNDAHRRRCDELRADVEAAIGGALGRAVTVSLVVDEDAGASSGMREVRPSGPPPPDDTDEAIDLSELTDAPASGSLVDQLSSAFPGAEVIQE